MSLTSGLALSLAAALAFATPQAHAAGTAAGASGSAPPHSRSGKVHHGSGGGTKAKTHASAGHKKAPATG